MYYSKGGRECVYVCTRAALSSTNYVHCRVRRGNRVRESVNPVEIIIIRRRT